MAGRCELMLVDVFAARFAVVGASDFRNREVDPLVVPPWQIGAGAQAVDRREETQPTGVLQESAPVFAVLVCNRKNPRKTGRLVLANARNTTVNQTASA